MRLCSLLVVGPIALCSSVSYFCRIVSSWFFCAAFVELRFRLYRAHLQFLSAVYSLLRSAPTLRPSARLAGFLLAVMKLPSSSVEPGKTFFAHVVDNSQGEIAVVYTSSYKKNRDGTCDCPFIKNASRKSGKTTLFFSESEISTLTDKFKFALIGKFQWRRPTMEVIRKSFDDLKLVGKWKVRLMDGRHVLIQLTVPEDYTWIFFKKIS